MDTTRVPSTKTRTFLKRAGCLSVVCAGVLLCLLWALDPLVDRILERVSRSFQGTLRVGHVRPTVSGLRFEDLVLEGPDARPVLRVPRGTLALHPLRLVRQRHLLAVLGDLDLEQPDFRVEVAADGTLNLARLKPPHRAGARPILQDCTATVRIRQGSLFFQDARGPGFLYQLGDWAGELALERGRAARIRWTGVPVQEGSGRVTLAGTLHPVEPRFNLELAFQGLDLKRLAEHPLLPRAVSVHAGRLEGALWARCDHSDWKQFLGSVGYGGRVELTRGVARVAGLPVPVRQIRAALSLVTGVLTLQEARANLAGMGAEARGQLLLPPQSQVDLLVVVPRLRSGPLATLLQRDLPVEGQGRLEVALTGGLASLHTRAHLRAASLTVQGQQLRGVEARGRLDGNLLTLENLRAEAGQGEVQGEGLVILGEELGMALSLSGEGNSLVGISPVGGEIGSFDLSILGSPRHPVVLGGTPAVYGFTGAAGPIDRVSGRFLYHDGDLVLQGGVSGRDGSELRVPYALYDLRDPRLSAIVTTSGFEIPRVHLGGLGDLGGRIRGRFQVEGRPTDLEALSALGLSEGTELRLNGLEIGNLSGAVGVQDLQLLIPGMKGDLAGGSLQAAGWIGLGGGSSNLVAAGRGADLSAVVSVLDRPLPVFLAGSGDYLFSWANAGRGQPHWLSAAVTASGGEGHGAYRLAGHGFTGPQGMGAVAWFDGLPLARRRLTSNLDLDGAVTGRLGAWGRLEDYNFAYQGELVTSEVTGLRGNRLIALGEGRIQGPQVTLGENLVRWEYDRRRRLTSAPTGWQGHALPWFGPDLAADLAPESRSRPPLPEEGSARISGSWRLGLPPEYQLEYAVRGVDLGWLSRQPWLPEAGRLAANLNLRAGWAHSSGSLSSDQGLPRLGAGSSFEAPWLLTGSRQATRQPQVFSAVGRLRMGPNLGGRMGTLHLEPVVVSRNPFDPGLPSVEQLQAGRWSPEAPTGLFTLAGTLDGSAVDLGLTGRGWEVADALAFAPAAATFPRGLVTGWLEARDFRVRGVLDGDFLHSLEMSGSLALRDGFLEVAGYPVPVDSLSARISRHRGELVLEDLNLVSGSLRAQGAGGRNAAGEWTANLWTDNFPMDHFHYLGPPFTRLGGSGRMAALLQVGQREPEVYLGFEGRDMVWGAEPVPVEFPRVRLGGLEASPGGSLRTGPGVGIRVGLGRDRLSLEIPEGAAEIVARQAGHSQESGLSARGSVDFTLDRPEGLGAWFAGPGGPVFGHAGQPFRVSARDLQGDLLRLLAGLPSTDRRFTFSGDLELLGQWHRDHGPEALPGLPSYRLSVREMQVGQGQDASWSGLALEGGMELAYRRAGGSGHLVLEPFRMEPHQAAEGAARGWVEGQADLVLTGSPEAVKEGVNRLEFSASSVPFSDLGFLLPGLESLGRIEELRMSGHGPLVAPEFNVAVRMADAHLGPLQVAALEGGLEGGRTDDQGGYEVRLAGPDGGPVRLFLGSQRNPEQTVELSGNLPFRAQAGPALPDGRLAPAWSRLRIPQWGEMKFLARLNDTGLRLIDDFIPGVSATAGRLEGELAFSGTPARPTLEGRLDIENGKVVHDQLGTLTDLRIRTVFEEIQAEEAEPTPGFITPEERLSRLAIQTFQGKLGGQPFTVQGKAEMAGIEPTYVAVSLDGRELPLRWGDLFDGLADVDLELRARPGRVEGRPGTTLAPVISGDVNVHRGDMSLPLSGLGGAQATQGGGRLPVDYRIRLNLGDDVWVHALGSRIRVQGELWVLPHDQTSEPVLAGTVDLSRGVLSVPFYNVSFRVHQGQATFQSSRMPTLENVEAEAEVAGYQVTAFVNGTFPDLRLSFVSNPPLPEAEVHKLLAVGGLGYLPGASGPESVRTDLAQTGNFVTGQGLVLAAQFLAAPLTREIGRMLFLTDFSFEFLPPFSYAMKMAKALDDQDRFLLTLTRVMRVGGNQGREENLYGLEWRFQRHLLTRVAFDDYGQLRLWFQGFWDF